ncbi:MAG: hypothetical protein ACRETX_04140, partial [Steroidobacteraceae bacterium]
MRGMNRARLALHMTLALGMAVLAASAWVSYHSIESPPIALATVVAVPLAGLALLAAAVYAMRRDFTDRKHAEEAQRATEARLGTIVDSVMDAIISMDEQQRIVL